MTFKRSAWISFALCLLAFGFAAWMYPHLPESIPTHWDAAGNVNGYTDKPWGVFLMPIITLGLWLLMLVLPRIAPKGYRLDGFLGAYGAILLALVGVFFAVTVVLLLQAGGMHFNVGRLATMLVGVLLIAMGNYMGKLRKNFFIGVRTPWTLANDEVWARTHHLAGWLFVLAGAVCVVAPAFGGGTLVFVIAVATAALTPVGYSYFLYRKLVGFDSKPDPSG
jgi:uncharacterized membrane protein